MGRQHKETRERRKIGQERDTQRFELERHNRASKQGGRNKERQRERQTENRDERKEGGERHTQSAQTKQNTNRKLHREGTAKTREGNRGE